MPRFKDWQKRAFAVNVATRMQRTRGLAQWERDILEKIMESALAARAPGSLLCDVLEPIHEPTNTYVQIAVEEIFDAGSLRRPDPGNTPTVAARDAEGDL